MIYLMRHGLDDEKFIGGYSDVDLIPEGVVGVVDSAYYIRDNLKIDRIITSDIKRSVTSAKLVQDILKRNWHRDIPLETSSLIRELDKGTFTGREKEKLTEEEKKFIMGLGINDSYPNGESMQDMYNRVKKLIDDGYFFDKDNTLIVTHRGIINMLYFILNDEPLSMNKTKFLVTHASIHELDFSGDRAKIRKIH